MYYLFAVDESQFLLVVMYTRLLEQSCLVQYIPKLLLNLSPSTTTATECVTVCGCEIVICADDVSVNRRVMKSVFTCQRVSARQCCIGNGSFQWGRLIFKGPPTENPLSDQHQILNKSLPSQHHAIHQLS
jgi:hypothetical protein